MTGGPLNSVTPTREEVRRLDHQTDIGDSFGVFVFSEEMPVVLYGMTSQSAEE